MARKTAPSKARREGVKRAIVYGRVSTDDQAEKGYSLPTQLDAGRKYAQEHGFKVVAEFNEDYSGATPIEHRPEGKKAYAMLASGKADALIVYTVDRLVRPPEEGDEWDTPLLIRGLAKLDKEIHTCNRGQLKTDFASLLIALLDAKSAGDERRKIIERTVRGKNTKAQSGRMVMVGHAPYGYRREGLKQTAKLIIYEPEAKVVRMIFDWYVNGDSGSGPLSMSAITQKLDKMGAPLPSNKVKKAQHWYEPTLSRIVLNELYAGRDYYGKTQFRNHIKQPRGNWIAIEVPELAIVDREVFEAAQERKARNLILARRNRIHPYLLSGFIRCGVCGYAMVGTMISGGPKDHKVSYPFYRCSSHASRRPCTIKNKHFHADTAEDAAWQWLKGLLEDEKKLDKGLLAMEKRAETEIGPKKQRLDEARKMLAEAERKLSLAASDVLDQMSETAREAIKNHVETLAKQADELRGKCERLENELAQQRITPELKDRIKRQAAQIRDRLANTTFAEKRMLFDALNLTATFRIDQAGKRWLDVSCSINARGKTIPLPVSPNRPSP